MWKCKIYLTNLVGFHTIVKIIYFSFEWDVVHIIWFKGIGLTKRFIKITIFSRWELDIFFTESFFSHRALKSNYHWKLKCKFIANFCLFNSSFEKHNASIKHRTINIYCENIFMKLGSLQETQNQFREQFQERENLVFSIIWYNVRKFEQNGSSLYRNKGNSGRHRTGRSAKNVELRRSQPLSTQLL